MLTYYQPRNGVRHPTLLPRIVDNSGAAAVHPDPITIRRQRRDGAVVATFSGERCVQAHIWSMRVAGRKIRTVFGTSKSACRSGASLEHARNVIAYWRDMFGPSGRPRSSERKYDVSCILVRSATANELTYFDGSEQSSIPDATCRR